jgi:hypothetical protein
MKREVKGTAASKRLGNTGLETRNGLHIQEFTVTVTREVIFSSPKHLDLLWDPPNLISND